MTSELTFTVLFRGPFAVATGSASSGIDSRVDLSNPIPASSWKGLMRHEAVTTLGVLAGVVDRIFGTGQEQPAGWRWTDAVFAEPVIPSLAARVAVDADGRAHEHALKIGEQLWAATAEFRVIAVGPGAPAEHDTVVLRAAGRSISSLGHQRRRGLGWVSISDAADWGVADSETLLSIVSGA